MLVTEPAPSMVISNQSFAPGVDAIVPCTLKAPEKFAGYTAIVCNALLLLLPGFASMAPEVFCKGPVVTVNDVTAVLLRASGYAPSSTSKVPAALYPVSEYVTSLELSDFTSQTE